MTSRLRWNSKDLESLPEDGKRYEIIDGELYVSKQPHYYHQRVCMKVGALLETWSGRTGLGEANYAPGVIFAEDDDVAPDLVWSSFSRLKAVLESDGKLHAAPELVIEVLSPGLRNESRDREAKLKLYSRRGVGEYWIIDWITRRVEVYRREQDQLSLAATFFEPDILASPLLPGFSCPLAELFKGIPTLPEVNKPESHY
jgi:Uma2 family endonuclease